MVRKNQKTHIQVHAINRHALKQATSKKAEQLTACMKCEDQAVPAVVGAVIREHYTKKKAPTSSSRHNGTAALQKRKHIATRRLKYFLLAAFHEELHARGAADP